jgi:hypothetical protein
MLISDFEVCVVIIYDNYLFIMNLIYKNFKKKFVYGPKVNFYF